MLSTRLLETSFWISLVMSVIIVRLRSGSRLFGAPWEVF